MALQTDPEIKGNNAASFSMKKVRPGIAVMLGSQNSLATALGRQQLAHCLTLGQAPSSH